MSKRLKIVLIVVGSIVILAIGCRLAISPIVRFIVNSEFESVGSKNQIKIAYGKLSYEGNGKVVIENLSVVPFHADTLVHADRFLVQLNMRKLLLFKLSVYDVESDRLHIHFVKDSIGSNYAFLFKHSEDKPDDSSTRNYAQRCDQILQLLFRMLPVHASMKSVQIAYSNKDDELLIDIPFLHILNHRFTTAIQSTENGQVSNWICSGSLDDDKQRIEGKLFGANDSRLSLPFIQYKWNAAVQFDTLAFELNSQKESGIENIFGNAFVSGLTIHHERISPDTVMLDRGRFHYDFHIGRDYAELDSSSEILFNQLTFHPYVKLSRPDSTWHVIASINKRDFPAQELFSSLPHGLFLNLDGIVTTGTLNYHFYTDIDFANLNRLVFESSLRSKGFQILKMGGTDLAKMNQPFMYTAYDNNVPVKTFEIGPNNPDFRTYDQISKYLPLCIMQNEDAGFFHHAGFIPSAIRDALVVDLKRHRFVRGGSTISMQLVKNVFLSKNKTLARKMEEILITWLIENCRLTPKERMFEVYMNIAEWGPLVYGATDAARFYFDKDPSQLTLGECIFLTSIIPKPKHFRSSFDGLQLKPYYESFFNVILRRLVSRELIFPEEAEGITPESVVITGPAKQLLLGDSIQSEQPALELLPEPAIKVLKK